MANREDEIGTEEMQMLFAGTTRTKELRKYLETLNCMTLGNFLTMWGACFGKGSDAEAAKAKEIVEQAVKRAALAGANTDELEAALLHVAMSARARAPDYLARLHKAAGLKKGAGGAAGLDENALWQGVEMQRLGRKLASEHKGSTEVTKAIWDGLVDQRGRRLPYIDPCDVKSIADEGKNRTNDATTDLGEAMAEALNLKEGEAKAKKGRKTRTKENVLSGAYLVLTSLAAVSSVPVDRARVTCEEDDGEVTVGAFVERLDASYVECMDAYHWLAQEITKAADGNGAEVTWRRFWTAVKLNVDESRPKGKRNVAGALRYAIAEKEVAKEVAQHLRDEWAAASGKPGKGGGPPRKEPKKGPKKEGGRKGGRKGEEEEKEKEARKVIKKVKAPANTKKKTAGDRANTSGEVCWAFRTNGKCKFGDTCKHRHLHEEDGTDDEDVREREE